MEPPLLWSKHDNSEKIGPDFFFDELLDVHFDAFSDLYRTKNVDKKCVRVRWAMYTYHQTCPLCQLTQ